MKKLITLPYKTRLQIARKCEPFFLCFKRQKAFGQSRKVITDLLTPADSKRLDSEVWTLISATSQTIRYDSNSCQLSLNKNNYTTANKLTKKNINLYRMKELVSILEDQGYLTLYKGYYFKNSPAKGLLQGMRSCIEFHQKWLDIFNVKLCKTHGTAREFDLVILKDVEGNIVTHKGKRGIGVEKALLREWNVVLDATNITIAGEAVKPVYTTVFNNGSLQQGGRLYAGSFSSEPSKYRPTITINGEGCVEVDYCNIHFRILYHKYGIDFQEDAYAVERLYDSWDKVEFRKACKNAGVIMLNAKSRVSAQKALIRELGTYIYEDIEGNICQRTDESRSYSKRKYQSIENGKKAVNYIFDTMSELHKPISKHFFKAEWGTLQHTDSLIAKQVVRKFLAIGEVVLTYHDSFVCPSRLKDTLIIAMKEAWEIVLGTSNGFGVDIEFNNPLYIQGCNNELC